MRNKSSIFPNKWRIIKSICDNMKYWSQIESISYCGDEKEYRQKKKKKINLELGKGCRLKQFM